MKLNQMVNVTHILDTFAIDTDGTIDGMEPSNIITLDQDQDIPAETTFDVLEVVRKLEVNGTIAGRELDEFLPNPILTQSKLVSAACSFKELIVQGTVTVEESWNDEDLAKTLADVVYETGDDTEVIITSPKVFENLEVKGDIKIESNFVNDLNLDNILMTDRDQVVTFDTLKGDVFFTNLKLNGLFDGINATELEHNSVRTFGDQFIETPLIFTKNSRLAAKSASIKQNLNQVPVGEYLFVDQPVNLPEVFFKELFVEELKISGDVVGTGTCKSFNVTDLATNYLSKSRPQRVLALTRIKSLSTNGTFHAKTINEIDFEVFKKYMRGIKNFKSIILTGEQQIDNLIVGGSVKVMTINNRDFNQIVQNAIWLNRPNTIEGNLKFLDDVVVNGTLTVQEKINEKVFKTWVENWISNTEATVVLKSDKKFTSDVMVEESLKLEYLNSIKFENLLMLKDVMHLPLLNVYGNVKTEKLVVKGAFNKIPMKILENLYSYDAVTYTHIIKSNVRFNQPTTIDYLNVPILNQRNVSEWMANLIHFNENDVYITSEITVANQFIASQGVYIKFFNDIDMDFLNHVVLINDQSMVNIEGGLTFSNDVYSQLIGLKDDLYARFISSCDLQEMVNQALPIDRDISFNGNRHEELL